MDFQILGPLEAIEGDRPLPERSRRDRPPAHPPLGRVQPDSREAVELARGTGNAAALAYALDGRAAVILGPDTVAECLALGSELCEVAEGIGDMQRAATGQSHRIPGARHGEVRGEDRGACREGWLHGMTRPSGWRWPRTASGLIELNAQGAREPLGA
jgi:hypothetical protein